MSVSFAARITFGILKLINFKRLVEKGAKRSLKRSANFTPKKIKSKYFWKELIIDEKCVTTFEIKGRSPIQHVIFFHGGAYLFEAIAGHWNLAEKMLQEGNCRISMIDYPLSPESNYRDAYQMVTSSYDSLLAAYPNDYFVLMGDSAGGGLAMGFCQKLIKEKRGSAVSKCVLISPWLDMGMTNPDVKHYLDKDVILTLDLLDYASMLFSDGDEQGNYLLSPINGDIAVMPPTLVLYASEEIFKPECIKLSKMALAQKAPFTFSEFEGMQHDWPIFPISEQAQAITVISDFLRE